MSSHKNLIKNFPCGFAYHKIILDEAGKPVDFEFIEVNNIYEKITGVNSQNIIGIKGSQTKILNNADVFSVYSDVALNGGHNEFEYYSSSNNRYYKVQVYSPEKYYFACTYLDITEYKDTSANLIESEGRYKDLFEANKGGITIFYINPDDTLSPIVEANKNFAKMLGMTKEEIIGRMASDLEVEITQDFALGRKQELKKYGSSRFETKLRHKNGKEIPVEIIATVLKYQNRLAIMNIAHDLTKQKIMETALRERELFLNTLINAIPFPIFFKDSDYAYKEVNDTFNKFFGGKGDQFVGKSVFDLYPPELAQIYEKKDFEIIKEGTNQQYETVLKKADGELREVIVSKALLRDTDNQILGIVGSILDITDRKRAEAALQESEERLFTLINSSPDLIVFKDGTGKWFTANKAILDIFSLNNVDYYRKTGKELANLTLPLYRNAFLNCDISDAKAWESKSIYRFDENIPLADGTVQTFDFIKVPVFDSLGNRKGLVELGRNVTDRKFAEEELKKAHKEMVVAIKEKDKFFSIIAHDLRSPFHGFLAGTKIMAEEMENMSMRELQEIASNLQHSAENLYKLLENLLEWSRIQRGLGTFELSNVPLNTFVASIINTQKLNTTNKGITIFNNLERNLIVCIDANMINTVFRNLLSNAIKFTPAGGKIEIASKRIENYIEFSVKDSGIGIPEKIIPNLFIVGEKTSRPGTNGEPSTGLGLILCKEYIEKHNGKLWVESKEGLGSTFYFTIPNKQIQ